MGDMMGSIVWVSGVTAVLYILLLAAAFVRRLHDSNLAGWWGLIPAACQIFALSRIPATMDAMKGIMTVSTDPNPYAQMQGFQQQMGITSLVGWVPLIMLVVLGIRKSTDGPNRYGEAPVRF